MRSNADSASIASLRLVAALARCAVSRKLHSASPGSAGGVVVFGHPADSKSVIQQIKNIKNLRYICLGQYGKEF